ncbi:MAG: dockerin type I domain-containing protein [Planctomycetota bacterium]
MSVFSILKNLRFSRSVRRDNLRNHRKKSQLGRRIELLESRHLMATDVILEWNDVLLAANAVDHSHSAEQGGPVLTARAFAIVSVSMYDAFNSIERIGAPFLIRAKVGGKSDSDAAVAQAAHDTLTALYPSQRPRFDAALTETLARIPDGASEDRGRALGATVAEFVLLDRANDGVTELMQFDSQYQPKGLPGFHGVDPLHPNQGFYAPGASHVLPFAVDSVDQFQARRLDDGTPEGRIAFMQSSEYKAAYDEVISLGSDGISAPTLRTPEQTQIGLFWGYDGRPGLGTPPRLYNQIAHTIANQQNNSVAENARLFALINVAQADAGLAAWNGKYDDDFWRPILGIRGADTDGNPDTVAVPGWIPLGAPASNPKPGDTNFTPPFPAYVSGHASFGASVFQTLKRFYGRDDIKFTVISDEFNGITRDADGSTRPVVPRTFNSFSQAKLENAQSRIYLGIHWAFDRDDGIKTGDGTANFIYDHILRPKSSPGESLRHNTFDPMDVDDDGACTPLDVLNVVNMINSHNTSSPDFVDVDDDHTISPLDALTIINRLNALQAGQGGGEGESTGRNAQALPPWFTMDRSGAAMTSGQTAQQQDVLLKRTVETAVTFIHRSVVAEQRIPLASSTDGVESREELAARLDLLSLTHIFARLGEK